MRRRKAIIVDPPQLYILLGGDFGVVANLKTLPLTVKTVKVEISWGSPIANAIVDHPPYPMVSNVIAIAGNGNPPTSSMVPSFKTFHVLQLGQLMVCSSPLQKKIKLEKMLSVAFVLSVPYVLLDMICRRLQQWPSEFACLQGLQEQSRTLFLFGTGIGIICLNY
jgi:hypothetical protein